MTLPLDPQPESLTPVLAGLSRLFSVWISVLLIGLSSVVQAEAPQDSYLQGLSKVGGVYIGPQPDASALEGFKADGIQTVINFRTAEEMAELAFDPEQILAADGIRYHLIPTGGEQTPIGPDQLRQLDALMSTVEGPVVMHCRSGYRAGVVLAAWLHTEHGLPLPDVITAIGDTRITVDAVNPVLQAVAESRP